MKKLFLLAVGFLLVIGANATQRQTMTYAIKGLDTLNLTRYFSDSEATTAPRPCIIFMFGGGFFTGDRNAQHYISFFENYAQKGYEVITIDYRLGLKGMAAGEKGTIVEMVALIKNTINMAVADLFDATNFVLGHRQQWNIDPQRIVSCGSSAGAISVLQAEYNVANRTQLASVLPEGFRYAGVISFAGAIFSTKGKVKWATTPSPILMFHGDADSNVPYNKMTLIGKGFYGSKAIVKSLDKRDFSYYFSSFENYAHEIASTPMNLNRYDIDEFLDKMVNQKQQLTIAKSTTDNTKEVEKKRFGIKDYLRSNFKQ